MSQSARQYVKRHALSDELAAEAIAAIEELETGAYRVASASAPSHVADIVAIFSATMDAELSDAISLLRKHMPGSYEALGYTMCASTRDLRPIVDPDFADEDAEAEAEAAEANLSAPLHDLVVAARAVLDAGPIGVDDETLAALQAELDRSALLLVGEVAV